MMKTSALFFPFDLFGNSGTRAGAELLADAFQEMLADQRREKAPTRPRAYRGQVRFEEFVLEKLADYESWREDARQAIRAVRNRGDFLLWITGNHLGVLPLFDEIARAHAQGSPSLGVVQFDAHYDAYHLTECTPELSHGNYLLHIEGPRPPIVHVGSRDLFLKRDYLDGIFRATIPAADWFRDENGALARLAQHAKDFDKVIIDIDCDVFDPASFPAVSQPEPFGLTPQLVLRCLETIGWDKIEVLALSEFDPARDDRDRSLATLMWLIEYTLLRKYEKVS